MTSCISFKGTQVDQFISLIQEKQETELERLKSDLPPCEEEAVGTLAEAAELFVSGDPKIAAILERHLDKGSLAWELIETQQHKIEKLRLVETMVQQQLSRMKDQAAKMESKFSYNPDISEANQLIREINQIRSRCAGCKARALGREQSFTAKKELRPPQFSAVPKNEERGVQYHLYKQIAAYSSHMKELEAFHSGAKSLVRSLKNEQSLSRRDCRYWEQQATQSNQSSFFFNSSSWDRTF